jgi:superkiller protein 3
MHCLRKALWLDPNYEEAHYNLGCEYSLRKQYARAEKHLRRALEIDPKYALAYAELGWVFLRRKKELGETIRMLKKSIRLNPDYGWSRIYLANALWQHKKYKAANEQYRKAIEIWPDSAVVYWCYGSFLAYEGESNAMAEEYLRRAVELDPKDGAANYNLGKHLLNWNRRREAVRYLRKAAKQGHDRARVLLEREGERPHRAEA